MLDDFTRLKVHFEQVAAEHNLDSFQLFHKINGNHPVPCSVFCKRLSPLESVVKFLHEQFGYSFTEIAKMLGRSPKTIWQTAHNAMRKYPEHFILSQEFMIPASIFSQREKSIFRAAVSYLHDEYKLSFAKIAKLTERDQRSVWATYHRDSRKNTKTNKVCIKK
ncbi:MAG: sigma factor-like helix-turn-helix DNA-binding protein [Candidatus Woesearchaeota archaeon]